MVLEQPQNTGFATARAVLWETSHVNCGGEHSSLLIALVEYRKDSKYRTEINWPWCESHQRNWPQYTRSPSTRPTVQNLDSVEWFSLGVGANSTSFW